MSGKKIQKKKKIYSNTNKIFTKPVIVFSIILAAIVLISFFRTLGYEFIVLDDKFLITGWFQGASLNIHDFFEVFKRSIGDSFYRPVLALTVVWDEGMGGISAGQYHTTNLFLYLASGILVYWLLLKLNIQNYLAAVLSLLFVVHPLNVSACAWIFGRNEPLLAVLFLSSFIFFINYLEEPNQVSKYIYGFLHLVFFFFSLYSKETAFVTPLILILYIYFWHREKLQDKEVIVIMTVWVIFAVVWFMSRQSVLGNVESKDIIGIEALAKNWQSFFAITGKMFLPRALALNSYYDTISVVSGIIAFIGLIAIISYKRQNMEGRIFGFIWMALFLIPPMLIVSKVDFDYAEHRGFLPMIGLMILLAKFIENFNLDYKKNYFRIPAALLACVLIIISQMYLPVFANANSFWDNLNKTYPDRQVAYAVGGGVLFNNGMPKESLEILQKGINATVKSPMLYLNLATVNLSLNKYDVAENFVKEGLKIDSSFSKLWNISGMIRLKQSDTLGAIKLIENAIAKDENNTEAFSNLSYIYLAIKNVDKAMSYLEKLVTLDKGTKNNFNNLGVCYYNKGNIQKAEESWLEAIKGKKPSLDAFNNLIMIYVKSNPEQAKQLASRLVSLGGKLRPDLKKAVGF